MSGGESADGDAEVDAPGGETANGDTGADPPNGDGYGGLFGAFPYAFRHSDSRLFRLYAVLGGGLALMLGLGFLAAFVVAVAGSVGLAVGGTQSFVRAFVLFVGFLVVFPLLAPVLLVARHHRRTGDDRRYDRSLAATGFLYAFSLYLAAVVSTPPDQQEAVEGLLAPVVSVLYGLPAPVGLLPPVVAAVVVSLAHRRYR